MQLQITFFHNENKYKPISAILNNVPSMEEYQTHKAKYQLEALKVLAHQRKTVPSDLIKQGYTKVKAREYDKEQIERVKKLKSLMKKRGVENE